MYQSLITQIELDGNFYEILSMRTKDKTRYSTKQTLILEFSICILPSCKYYRLQSIIYFL